jgi:hypothetical protein
MSAGATEIRDVVPRQRDGCPEEYQMPDSWLTASCIRKVLRPANSIKVFRGFPWSQSKC